MFKKLAKILSPGSVDAKSMGRDIAEAAAFTLPEERRKDFVVLNEGMFANIAQECLSYHSLHSGKNRNIAIRDARASMEQFGDDVAEEISIADQLPTTPSEIPADRSGLTALLQIADKQPKSFDTGDIEAWYTTLATNDDSALAQVQSEMASSGMFSSEQRMADFEDKLVNTYMHWQGLVTQAELDKQMAGEARENIREQKGAEQAVVDQSIIERSVGLEDMSPAMRAKVEERQAEQAKAQIAAQEREEGRAERKTEFQGAVAPAEEEIPGLDQFIRDLQQLTQHSPDEPPDEEKINRVHHFIEAVKGAAKEHPEVPWDTSAATLAKDFGLEDDFRELYDVVRIQKEQREKAKEFRPPTKAPAETVPESQKAPGPADELPPGVEVTSALIKKHEEYDKTKGPWEIDLEAKALRRRKIMVQNALLGRPALPYGIGDTVAFSRNSAFECGEIEDITEEAYILKTASGNLAVAHASAFEPSNVEGLF